MELEIIKKNAEGLIEDVKQLRKINHEEELSIHGSIKAVADYMQTLAHIQGRAELIKMAIERMEDETK